MPDLPTPEPERSESRSVAPEPSLHAVAFGETAPYASTDARPDVGRVTYWIDENTGAHVAEFSRLKDGETYALLHRQPTADRLVKLFPPVVDLVLMHTTGLPGVVDEWGLSHYKPTLTDAEIDHIRSEAQAMLEGLVCG